MAYREINIKNTTIERQLNKNIDKRQIFCRLSNKKEV